MILYASTSPISSKTSCISSRKFSMGFLALFFFFLATIMTNHTISTFYLSNTLPPSTVGTACWDSISTFPNFSLCFFYPLRSRFLALLVWFPFFHVLFYDLRFLLYCFTDQGVFHLFPFLLFSFGVWGFLILLCFVFYTPWPEKGTPLIYGWYITT